MMRQGTKLKNLQSEHLLRNKRLIQLRLFKIWQNNVNLVFYTYLLLYIDMEFKKSRILLTSLIFLLLFLISNSLPRLSSFQELGEHHCSEFPIQLLWRISTGTLSEKYGEQYFDYDCYVRQFVKKDGMTVFETLESEEDEEESQEETDEEQQQQQENIPQIDPLVEQYSQGIKKCLPSGVEPVEAVYAMWRFIRFVVQHDYTYEWMRAKIRSGMGYEAEKPSAWMDGETKAERLRLDKLFSNQFYEYVDKLMFKDFLYPIMTFLKKNTVFALSGDITQSGKPILIQSLQTHNYLPKIFMPIILLDDKNDIFTYTIPGIPLLFAGSNSQIAWGFTGVLVDRSNVEQIETINNKFYNHDTEEWIPLTEQQIPIPGVQNKTCTFIYSASGTLYTRHSRQGKVSEYISKWHENEKKVRNLFSDMYRLIQGNGALNEGQYLEFPFNSIMMVNQTGIFQYLCPQFYPSYFLYPDMFGEPERVSERWISYPKKKYVAVSNTQLTTMKQQTYKKHQFMSPTQEQIAINIRKFNLKMNKFNIKSAMNFLTDLSTNPYVKKQRDMLVSIYRKVKFIYFPEDDIRKRIDQVISHFEGWDNSLHHENLAPIYILWEYFYRQYTFNHVSASEYGLAIARHKAVSEVYWANQMGLWFKGTSYGQCDSHQYQQKKHEYNGTGQNSTCYFNIMRGINRTTEILWEKYDGDLTKISLSHFTNKKIFNLGIENYKGSHIEEAFNTFYSRNIFFGAEIDRSQISYNSHGYLESQIQDLEITEPTKLDEGPPDEL